jgi:uncharacterized protein (TIGR00255 family)
MILSMTGYGSAEQADGGIAYALELRSLNNRYFKLSTKLPESLQFLEPEVEAMLRAKLGRGSVTYVLRIRNQSATAAYDINKAALANYVRSICQTTTPEGVQASVDLAALAALPGVCQPPQQDEAFQEQQRRIVRELTAEAVDQLLEMRRAEGRALAGDLRTHCQSVRGYLEVIAQRAPNVISDYQERLKARVQSLLAEARLELEADTLAREVAIFADRCDVSEEVARLRSHLDQFDQVCSANEHAGRKLDFLVQEMLREANTIGSKSNDAAIARAVIETKAAIDRLKEQIQNVE